MILQKIRQSKPLQYLMEKMTAFYTTLLIFLGDSKRKLKENAGNMFTENAILLIIVVVVGGIFMALVIALIRTKVMPAVENKVDGFFATT